MSLGPLQLSSSTMDHEGQMETNNQAGVTKEEKTKGDLEEEKTFAAIHGYLTYINSNKNIFPFL